MTNTLATMIARINDETEQESTQDATITSHIKDAIAHYHLHRFWFLEAPTGSALTSTTTASDSYVDLYTGMLEIDSLRITDNGQKSALEPVKFETMESYHDGTDSTGLPWAYCRYGGRVRLYPTPDATYTLTWSGLLEQASLDDTSSTNAWMTDGEQLIRARARRTFIRDVLIDAESEAAASRAEMEALQAIERQSVKYTATRRIRPRM